MEQVVISAPSTAYLHCRVAVRKDKYLHNSAIVSYDIGNRTVVARVSDQDLLAMRPHMSIVVIYALVQGQASDETIRCVAMFGPAGGFTESWLVEVDMLAKRYSLLRELPKGFW